MTTLDINKALDEVYEHSTSPSDAMHTLVPREAVLAVQQSALNVLALQQIVAGEPVVLMLPKVLAVAVLVGQRLEQNQMLAALEREGRQ